MMAESSGQPSGAARRRRERRLRSMLRHEQQTVRMALAAALHHSAGPREKVEKQQNGAPRGQKTAGRAGEGEVHEQHDGPRAQNRPLPGTRPEPLAEVSEPQGPAATVGYVAARPPLIWWGPKLLADSSAEAIDGRTLRYLLKENLARKKEEEEEEERRKEEEKEKEKEKAVRSSASSAPKRTRKKRRKKKAPRGVRIRRCGQRFCSRSSLSGARMMPFTLSSLRGAGPRCAASGLICSRRTVGHSSSFLAVACARLVLLVFMLLVSCFMAGMDQKNSYVVLSCHGAEAVSYGPDCSADFPQLQFIARWLMSSSCFYCRFHRCSSWRSWLTCPFVCNVRCWPCLCSNCGGLRSCSPSASWSDVYGGFGRILHFFYMKVNSGPEVVFHSGNLVSTSPLYLAVIRVHASAVVAYGRISFFYVKVDMYSEVDSRPAGVVCTRKSGHYLYEDV